MIEVREARESDAAAIREIFKACYGAVYPYPEYYDLTALKRMVYSDDTLVLVAEDLDAGRIVGTASVVFATGAYSDLVGEFGRLAVDPECWGRGAGSRLMVGRIERVRERLHVGLVEARTVQRASQLIAVGHRFAAVGFYPLKVRYGERREHLAILVRHFGGALGLRRNCPRIVPEAYPLAGCAMDALGLALDVVVDEDQPPYPHAGGFDLQELTTEGYSDLLRIERGRVRQREIFGPLRLHYGFFKLKAHDANYLIAREEGRVAAAVGFTHDPFEENIRVFEVIWLQEEAIRFLFVELVARAREQRGAATIEIDVAADAPRMQRTLLELGFVPVAYMPAMAFHQVERRDVVKMARLLVPFEVGDLDLVPQCREAADLVLRAFARRDILPRIAAAMDRIGLFAGLSREQGQRLAGACRCASFDPGETVFGQGEESSQMYLLLSGEAAVEVGDGRTPVGRVGAGECLGEVALLTGAAHSATATAANALEAAVLTRRDLRELVRLRPDIGVVLYRNLAQGLAEKLVRTDLSLAGRR